MLGGNDTSALTDQLSSLAASGAALSPEQGQQLVSAFFATAAPPAEEDTQAATNTLNLIASLIVASGSSVKIETAAFEFAAVPAPTEITAVPVQGGSIDVPPVPGVAAMSIIAWKRPDAQQRRRRLQGVASQQATNMIAISALASDGTAATIQNLTEPFRLSWDAAAIDTPPANHTDGNDTIHYEPECVYLNRQLGTWETDGCHTTIAPDGSLTCACNHLTEFAARFRAIRAKNAALFAAASQLYTIEGLIKYKYYFIFFGSFIAGSAILLIVLSRLDRKAAFVYQKLLAELDEIRFLYRTHKGRKPFIVDRIYPAAKELMHSPTSSVEEPQLPAREVLLRRSKALRLLAAAKLLIRVWKNRIFHQHSYLSIFFRYDPRLGRTYRAIFILTTIFHSLFVSAFFYGYTHGVDTAPTVAETLFLAVLTSAINIPVLKFFYTLMNRAGTAEYKWRYPYIFTELKRRHDFEAALQNVQLGDIDEEIRRLMREMGRDISVDASEDTGSTTGSEQAAIEIQGADMAATATQDDSVETYLLLVLGRICRRRKRESHAQGLLVAKAAASQLDPEFSTPNCISRLAPFHTAAGAIAYFVPIGWFIWCINYLLLFAASNSDDDSLYVFKSYGISQLTSLLFVNPLTILIGLVIGLSVFLVKQRCGKEGVVTPGHPIQVLSDPLYKPGATTSLSAKFGYWLFLKAPAEVSLRAPGVAEMDIACANPAAVNGHIQEIIRGGSGSIQYLKAAGGENTRDATISMLYYLYRGIALGCE
jgi:GPCR proteolysis site, GPS, motif